MIGTMTSTVVIELIKYTVKKEGYSCIRQLFFPKKSTQVDWLKLQQIQHENLVRNVLL